MAPQYQICTTCPRLLGELPRLRRKELSPVVAKNKSQPETIVDKDNHGWDCIKVFLRQFPMGPVLRQTPRRQTGTFAWWQRQAPRTRRSSYVRR
jgi:hypothetical protein